jgi:hypothetical protein
MDLSSTLIAMFLDLSLAYRARLNRQLLRPKLRSRLRKLQLLQLRHQLAPRWNRALRLHRPHLQLHRRLLHLLRQRVRWGTNLIICAIWQVIRSRACVLRRLRQKTRTAISRGTCLMRVLGDVDLTVKVMAIAKPRTVLTTNTTQRQMGALVLAD